MYGLSLDLRDHARVGDFIQEQLSFLSDTERRRVERLLEQRDASPVSAEHLADLALRVGAESWAPRRALAAFLRTQQGGDEEWRMTVAAASNSTGHLMQRFRHGTQCVSLDETLGHEESASAFRDRERTEIAEVLRHVHAAIWQSKRKDLTREMEQEALRLKQITQRLNLLRELAAGSSSFQDELFGKLAAWEDELFFVGRTLNNDELDEEIRYYGEIS